MERITGFWAVLVKAVAVVLGGCFALITAATIVHLMRSSEYTSCYQGVVPFNLAVGACMVVVVLLLVRVVDRLGSCGQRAQDAIAVVLFLLMGALTLCVAFEICPRPDTDSFDCIDAGAYLLKYGKMDDGFAQVTNMGRFGNNRIIAIVFKDIIAMFPQLDSFGIMHVLYVVNALCIMAAVAFTYGTVRTCRGAIVANRVLALCALNPLYYGLVCWVYSLTFSLPIMMGALYVGLRAYRADCVWKAALWAAVDGALLVLGFEIRPTACFVIVALAIVACMAARSPMATRRLAARRLLAVAVASVLTATLCVGLFSSVKARYYSEVQDRSYPVTYWLSLGSHGTGSNLTNGADYRLVNSLEPEDRFFGMLDRALGNYWSNGVVGTLQLWAQKTARTWSNGHSGVWNRMTSNESGGSLAYELMGGDHKDLYVTYGHAFRLLTNVGIMLACLKTLRRRPSELSRLSATLMLTLLVGIAFYCLWEAKSVYSAPFVLAMIVLAAEGWEYGAQMLAEASPSRRVITKRVGFATLAVVVACSAIPLWGYATVPVSITYYRIRSMVSKRMWSALEFEEEVCQGFFVDGSFNRIALSVRENEEGTEGAGYSARLMDGEGREIGSWEFGLDDAVDSEIVLPLNTVVPAREGEWYELVVTRLGDERSGIDLMTGNATFCDSYRGEQVVDGAEVDANDLKMDVRYEVVEPMIA